MRPAAGSRTARLHLACLGLAICFLACGSGSEPAAPSPSVSEESAHEAPSLVLEGPSEAGRYRIRAQPAALPVELHEIHEWVIHIDRAEGSAEIPTAIRFDGGMPAHGHGFVTQPRVTRNLGNGEFLVEGVKFHMPGAWVLRITVASRSGSDHVTLPLTIEP